MRESQLLAAIYENESDASVIDLREANVTLVQAQSDDLIDRLVDTDPEGARMSQAKVNELKEGVRLGLEDFYQGKENLMTSPIVQQLEETFKDIDFGVLQDTIEEGVNATKEQGRASMLFQKVLQTLLKFKFLLLLGGMMAVAHNIERVITAVGNVVETIKNWNPLNRHRPVVDAAGDVSRAQSDLDTVMRDPNASEEQIREAEQNLVIARENLAERVSNDENIGFNERTPTTELERRMEGYQRQIDVARRMGNTPNPLYVGQVEALRQEIETRRNDPEWEEPVPEGFRERSLDLLRRGRDFMTPDRPASPAEPVQELNGAEPLEDQGSRMGRMFGRLFRSAEASDTLPEDMPLTFGDVPTVVLPPIEVHADEFPDHEPLEIPINRDAGRRDPNMVWDGEQWRDPSTRAATNALAMEKMESDLTSTSKTGTINPTSINMPTNVVTNNNTHVVSPTPDPYDDDRTFSTYRRLQLPFGWGR